MALTINVPDSLRRAVESASSGKITVMYTAKGQASFMSVIPSFTKESIEPSMGTGIHPMFSISGVSKTFRYIGAYPGVVRNGELLSLPGVSPSIGFTLDQAVAVSRANGASWGLTTGTDWSGLAQQAWKNGTMPRGNTNYGTSFEVPSDRSVSADSGRYATSSSTAHLTGSGPLAWRHDGTAFGVADLAGGYNEWAPGFRIHSGELQVVSPGTGQNSFYVNAGATTTLDFGAASLHWYGIDALTGITASPGSATNIKIGSAGSTVAYTIGAEGFFTTFTNASSTPVANSVIASLKLQGLFPVATTGLGDDYGSLSTTGVDRQIVRGVSSNNGSYSGIFACSSVTRIDINTSLRPSWFGT